MHLRTEIHSPGIGEDAMLSPIGKAVEDTLTVWPEPRAAVPFGSCARGDHPLSDWGIAFITVAGERAGPATADTAQDGVRRLRRPLLSVRHRSL